MANEGQNTLGAASIERVSGSSASEDTGKAAFTEHGDFDVTIIWHNIYAPSSFSTFRKESRGPIERILVDFGQALNTGVFEQVLSLTATKNMFCVTVATRKNWEDDDLKKAIFMVL